MDDLGLDDGPGRESDHGLGSMEVFPSKCLNDYRGLDVFGWTLDDFDSDDMFVGITVVLNEVDVLVAVVFTTEGISLLVTSMAVRFLSSIGSQF
jgi:hypothetical protein